MRAELVYSLTEPPTPQCHASTLCLLSNGTLCAAWFGGTKEKDPDVNIWFSRRINDSWERPRCVASAPGAHWNPVLYVVNDQILLFYKRGENCRTWRTFLTVSNDGGKSFVPFGELVPGDVLPRGPVKNKPISVGDRILAPSSMESPFWYAFIDRSEDGGKTWTKSNDITADADAAEALKEWKKGIDISSEKKYPGIIQPTLWNTSEKDVYALFRSKCGSVFRSESHDGGISFSPAVPISLANNNSGLDAVRLKDGRILLVCNPITVMEGRSPLSVMLSSDNGVSFSKLIDLETALGEFSYPAVINAPGGGVHISYTWYRKSICHVYLSKEELQ